MVSKVSMPLFQELWFILSPKSVSSGPFLLVSDTRYSLVSFVTLSLCHTLHLTHQQVLLDKTSHIPSVPAYFHPPSSFAKTVAMDSKVISLLLFLHSYNPFSTQQLERPFNNVYLIILVLCLKPSDGSPPCSEKTQSLYFKI